jgi:hypothetical protein
MQATATGARGERRVALCAQPQARWTDGKKTKIGDGTKMVTIGTAHAAHTISKTSLALSRGCHRHWQCMMMVMHVWWWST